MDIAWCVPNQQNSNYQYNQVNQYEIIFALTQNGHVYKSENNGKSWESQNEKFLRKKKDQQTQLIQIVNIIKNPYFQDQFIFQGQDGYSFITQDCLQNVQILLNGRKINDFKFHPSQSKWILASAWTQCEDFQKHNLPCKIYKELYLTKNFGQDWQSLLTYVYQYEWSQNSVTDREPKERIIVSYEPKGLGNQTNINWNEEVRIVYSDNFFKSSQLLVAKGNRFLITDDFLIVARAQGEYSNLLISKDPHQKNQKNLQKQDQYNFKSVQIDGKNIAFYNTKSYTILDSHQDQISININTEFQNHDYGQLYISDKSGTNLQYSLDYHVRDESGQTDFEKFHNLNGVIISNIYDPLIMHDKHQEFLNNINQNPQSSLNKHNINPQKTPKNNKKKTLITFDNGVTWQPLNPPLTDQEFCSLQENCSLHLNSYSSSHKFGPVYSVEKAGGIIIGTGNIGAHLSTYQDQINTYVSIDGGWVWKQVDQGSHIYEIGDHGSVVVMASDQQATNFILYSIDDGQTWQKYQFQDQKIEVINIVTDPENKGLHFLILGKQVDQSTGLQTGVIIYFNLETLFIGRCQGYENPQILGSDFQIIKTNQCVLGQKMQHIVKRSGSKCYNGVDFQRTKNVEICQCTEPDWICDDGFQKDQQMNRCVLPDGTQNIDLNQSPPEQCYYYYQISMGYKKVPGNICEGGVDYSPIVKQCPQYLFRNIIILILILYAGYYLGFKNKHIVLYRLINVKEKIVNKLKGLVNKNQKKNLDSHKQMDVFEFVQKQKKILKNRKSFQENFQIAQKKGIFESLFKSVVNFFKNTSKTLEIVNNQDNPDEESEELTGFQV